MSSASLCFLALPDVPVVTEPLLSPDTEDPDSSVLDLSLKKRPRLDSSSPDEPPSPRLRKSDSGDECFSQDEFGLGDPFRQEASGMGTYKKHLLKRYCELNLEDRVYLWVWVCWDLLNYLKCVLWGGGN